MKKNDTGNFLKLLQEELEWPHVYMFKFVIPTGEETKIQVIELFPVDSKISYRASRTGKYTSITIKALMSSAEEVMAYYEKASKIEGIFSM